MRAQWLLMCVSTAVVISVATAGCSDAPTADEGTDAGGTGSTTPPGPKGHDAGSTTGNPPGVDAGKPPSNGGGTDAGAGGDDDATTPGTGDDAGTVPGKDAGGKADPCADSSLQWAKASKTSFESYPAPGSAECIQYSGCQYEGQFEGCNGTQPESWVKTHNIVSVFPNFKKLGLHDLCLRSGSKTIVVTALDTCADSDCSGCCTENAKPSGNLIDIEKYTDQRFGVADGEIEFADLGPTTGGGCK